MDLASIRTSTQQAQVNRILGRNGRSVWLGLNVKKMEGKFMWMWLNSKLTYSHWHRGEPNNWGRRGEDCAGLVGRNHKWNDFGCGMPTWFLCEKRAPKKTNHRRATHLRRLQAMRRAAKKAAAAKAAGLKRRAAAKKAAHRLAAAKRASDLRKKRSDARAIRDKHAARAAAAAAKLAADARAKAAAAGPQKKTCA